MWKIITEPSVEPVNVPEAKTHLRVDHSTEDVYIGGLITAARRMAEMLTQRAFITQTIDLYLDEWPEAAINIPFPPLQSVSSIKYKDTTGTEYTWDAANYIVDIGREPGRVVLADGVSWPSASLYATSPITVRFLAGYGAAGSNVPAAIRQALLLLIGHLYENREATSQNVYQLPLGAEWLLWPYREWVFG